MEKMNYPKGLIKYTTENALEGQHTSLLRPRVIVYTILLSVITGALIWGLVTRVPLEVDILRDRNALYNETDMGLVENVYHLKLINMSEQKQTFRLRVSGIEQMRVVGQTDAIRVASGAVIDLPLRIQVDPIELKTTSSRITFHIQSTTNPELRRDETARFLGPVGR
jgi:polyferredoxin